MPKMYEDIKQSYIDRGTSEDRAKELAARTYIKRGKIGTRSTRAKSLQSDRSTGR